MPLLRSFDDTDPFHVPSRMERFLDIARRQPSAFLLFGQIGALLAYPFLQPTQFGRVGVSLIGIVVLVIAVFTVRHSPALTWVSVVIGLPAVVLEIYGAIYPEQHTLLAIGHVLLAIFYFYTAYALVAYMFEDHWVTKDELFAVGACFTVIAWGFAYVNMAIQHIWIGESFTATSTEEILSFTEMLFVSVANLAGVGLSDVIPIHPFAMAIAMLSQIVGVLYIAMVISRLVALTVLRNR